MTANTARGHFEQFTVDYIRATVNFNDTGIATGVVIGTLPKGAIVLQTNSLVETTFNAATTNVLTVGTNGTTANNLVASGDVDETTAGMTIVKPATTHVPLTADTDVYAKYTQTGTAGTTGKAHLIVCFAKNNDIYNNLP